MLSRSREGAWIEIFAEAQGRHSVCVAPVRERGLKLLLAVTHDEIVGSLP